MLDQLSVRRKILAVFAALSALFVLSCVVFLFAVLNLSSSGLRVGERLAPLGEAAKEVKLTAAQASLELEALRRGDPDARPEQARALLKQSRFYAEAILNGAQSELDGHVYQASESEEVRAAIREVEREMSVFAASIDQIIEMLDSAQGVGSAADERFDALYDEITEGAAALSNGAVDNPAVQRLAGEARFLAANGHLLVEEVLGGDAGEDMAEATDFIAEAAAAMRALAAEAPDLAGEAEAIAVKLDEFAAQALLRYDTTLSRAATIAESEENLRRSYYAFVTQSEVAEQKIYADIEAGVADLETSRTIALAAPVAIALVFAGVLFLGYRMLARTLGLRLTELSETIRRLLAGDLDAAPPTWRSEDEVGHLRTCVGEFRDLMLKRAELEREVAARAEAAEADRKVAEAKSAQAEALKMEAEAASAEAETMRAEAETARAAAEHKQGEADVARAAAERKTEAVRAFATAFAVVAEQAAEGRFDRRIEEVFDDPQFRELSNDVNSLVSKIAASLNEVERVSTAMAEGDLSQRMNGAFKGDFAKLQSALNATIERTQAIVLEIRRSSEAIADDATRMRGELDELARRSSAQAAAVEETNASVKTLSRGMRATTDRVEKLASETGDTTSKAKTGGEIVTRAQASMTRIDETSQEVAAIVEMIENVAFQTNILALNASVEAARAGESGRGFAIVAQEVLALAQRTAEAAEEIRALVTKSNENVAEGGGLVAAAGEALTEALGAFREVARAAEEIRENGAEQAANARSIDAALGDIDRIAQENANTADEFTRSMRSLDEQAASLLEQVRFFRTGDDATAMNGGGRAKAA